jgi:hypothetical protein
MTKESSRFDRAIAQFDQANSQDPNIETISNTEHPKELLYAKRMSGWLSKFEPKAPETLQLAARSQHICRWTIPRDSYPMDRKGYLLWRTELKRFHARKAEEILAAVGYDRDSIERVKSLILKQRLKTDPESQTLEDVVCLVFLDHYFSDFAAKHEPEKVVSILKKTWNKMSDRGRKTALSLDLNDQEKALIGQAIEED